MTNAEMAETFQILGKYQQEANVVPQHDELFVGLDDDGQMSEADRKRMAELGWSWDENHSTWQRWT